jgi:hypothetical protein
MVQGHQINHIAASTNSHSLLHYHWTCCTWKHLQHLQLKLRGHSIVPSHTAASVHFQLAGLPLPDYIPATCAGRPRTLRKEERSLLGLPTVQLLAACCQAALGAPRATFTLAARRSLPNTCSCAQLWVKAVRPISIACLQVDWAATHTVCPRCVGHRLQKIGNQAVCHPRPTTSPGAVLHRLPLQEFRLTADLPGG